MMIIVLLLLLGMTGPSPDVLAVPALRTVDGPRADTTTVDATLSDTTTPDMTTVHVNVDGVQGTEGHVVVALYDEEDSFPRDIEEAAFTASVPIQNGEVLIRIEAVPAGRYAVVAFHDADDDGRVKTSWVGRPKEGIAVSNWTGGRPQFDRSAIDVGENAATAIDLTLRYF